MANYKKMYAKLFNTVTDVINILQASQVETEEMFMEQEKPIILLDNNDENE
jgi:hypothetical protein